MKNYCLVIICINKPFNCVIRLITIMIHNIRRNNSTIFNTDKLISLFDCIFDHFIWRETTFISLRQKIFSAQNFTHTVIKLSQFYKIFLFCISDNHRNLSLQLPICCTIIAFKLYHKTCEQFYRHLGIYEKSPNSFLPGLSRSIVNQFCSGGQRYSAGLH